APLGVGEDFGLDERERHLPLMLGMTGPEDRAEAALDEPVENVVAADDEVVGLAQEDLVDLEDGEPAALDERLGERTGLGAAAIGEAHDLVQLVAFEQRVVA